MAFAKLSAAGKDPVRTFRQGTEDKGRIDAAGTHHPEGPHTGRVLKPRDTGSIRRRVTAPVA